MKSLIQLLENMQCSLHYKGELPLIGHLTLDSREVKPGSLFIAHKGSLSDGFQFIPSAIEKGASAIVCTRKPEGMPDTVAFVLVNDTAAASAKLAANFYDHPSKKLILTGITGTNGKTTTATLLFDLFIRLGFKAGLISTVVYRIHNRSIPSSHTTPDPIRLNALLNEMVEAGCEYCFMEVSSHAIHQKRVEGIAFSAGVFTNITHDHLDYHGNFQEYLRVKKSFFDSLPKSAFAIFNSDDKNGKIMQQNCGAKKRNLSFRNIADYRGKIVEADQNGMLLKFNGTEFFTSLLGDFNAYNLMNVYAIACEFGLEPELVLQKISELRNVPGRFDTIQSASKVSIIIDYAHTPDALANVLETISKILAPGSKLICVVGAGGNRDKTKRPLMGRIALEKSDKVIFTSDNPRDENPDDIIRDMQAGLSARELHRSLSIPNRREAIRTALSLASAHDIVLIAGKGHETYQEIDGIKHHFDDKEEVENYLQNQV